MLNRIYSDVFGDWRRNLLIHVIVTGPPALISGYLMYRLVRLGGCDVCWHWFFQLFITFDIFYNDLGFLYKLKLLRWGDDQSSADDVVCGEMYLYPDVMLDEDEVANNMTSFTVRRQYQGHISRTEGCRPCAPFCFLMLIYRKWMLARHISDDESVRDQDFMQFLSLQVSFPSRSAWWQNVNYLMLVDDDNWWSRTNKTWYSGVSLDSCWSILVLVSRTHNEMW